jgi:hypothetical protein
MLSGISCSDFNRFLLFRKLQTLSDSSENVHQTPLWQPEMQRTRSATHQKHMVRLGNQYPRRKRDDEILFCHRSSSFICGTARR